VGCKPSTSHKLAAVACSLPSIQENVISTEAAQGIIVSGAVKKSAFPTHRIIGGK
jgi:hypothetical protein